MLHQMLPFTRPAFPARAPAPAGSTIKQGERHCVVYATGMDTFFGRAAALLGGPQAVSGAEG